MQKPFKGSYDLTTGHVYEDEKLQEAQAIMKEKLSENMTPGASQEQRQAEFRKAIIEWLGVATEVYGRKRDVPEQQKHWIDEKAEFDRGDDDRRFAALHRGT